MIGVGPEFWGMTMREFHCALDGYRDREKESRRFIVSVALLIRNALTKKNMSVGQVLKDERKPYLVDAASSTAFFRSQNDRLHAQKERRDRRLERMIRYGS